jgi:hypothetical protein
MGMIMIKCPQTGASIPTGVAMNKARFQAASLSANEVVCSACGGMHFWSKKDAWVSEGSDGHRHLNGSLKPSQSSTP